MFKTKIGKFDGNSWEVFCQQRFRLKYEVEGYQLMPIMDEEDQQSAPIENFEVLLTELSTHQN